jgi:hypothetical protein
MSKQNSNFLKNPVAGGGVRDLSSQHSPAIGKAHPNNAFITAIYAINITWLKSIRIRIPSEQIHNFAVDYAKAHPPIIKGRHFEKSDVDGALEAFQEWFQQTPPPPPPPQQPAESGGLLCPEKPYSTEAIYKRFLERYELPANLHENCMACIEEYISKNSKPCMSYDAAIERAILKVYEALRQEIPERDNPSHRLVSDHEAFYNKLFNDFMKYPRMTRQMASAFVSYYSKIDIGALTFHWKEFIPLDCYVYQGSPLRPTTVKSIFSLQHQYHGHYHFIQWLNPYNLIGEVSSIPIDILSKSFRESVMHSLDAKGKSDYDSIPNGYIFVMPSKEIEFKFMIELTDSLAKSQHFQARPIFQNLNGHKKMNTGDVCIVMPDKIFHQTPFQCKKNRCTSEENPNWFSKGFEMTFESKNMAVIMTEFHEVMCNWGAKPLVIDLPAHIVLDHSEESSPVTIESPKSLNPWGAAAP